MQTKFAKSHDKLNETTFKCFGRYEGVILGKKALTHDDFCYWSYENNLDFGKMPLF